MSFFTFSHSHRGFAITDAIYIVVALLIFAGAVFIAVQPMQRLRAFHNAERWQDVSFILDHLTSYQAANKDLPGNPLSSLEIGQYHVLGNCLTLEDISCPGQEGATTCLDLDALGILHDPPLDPTQGTPIHTGYFMRKHFNDTFTVGACFPEEEDNGIVPFIEVTE